MDEQKVAAAVYASTDVMFVTPQIERERETGGQQKWMLMHDSTLRPQKLGERSLSASAELSCKMSN